ncbi:MAG: 5-dehydro-2-deoxygluconokinase [Firmicutes bacterium]|nr:5-dehydro-2-deoxygluconokinase [Bacillota bacterium]
MSYMDLFDSDAPLDLIAVGRVALDFNPLEMNCTLAESVTFKKYLGGSPANITVGLARLGKKPGFIARVADDSFGDFAVNYFDKEGIDTSHLFRAENGEKMGLTFTEIKSPTESSILMYREGVADLSLCPADVDEEYIKSAKAVLISGTALCKSPSREAALKAIKLAKKNGITIIFDIDYRSYTWQSDDEISVYYQTAAEQSDIVIGSREEFDLTGRLIGLDKQDDISVARYWHDKGNKIVIIKHGKEGSVAYSADGTRYLVKPFPVKLLKSFGGGDGYASAFLYGLMEGWPLDKALEFGSAEAAMLVAAHSCSAAMPGAQAVSDFIAEEKKQYGEMVFRISDQANKEE